MQMDLISDFNDHPILIFFVRIVFQFIGAALLEKGTAVYLQRKYDSRKVVGIFLISCSIGPLFGHLWH
jgi:hypothetical protein